MKTIINSPPQRGITWQALLLGTLLAASATAQAGGTTAGTTVSNQATLNYEVGSVPQAAVLSDDPSVGGSTDATTFVVDNKVDVLVTGGVTTTSGVVPGGTNVTTTFTVTNEGNATQDFKLDVISSITTGDNFNPTSCTVSNVVINTGSMGTYTSGDQHINALTKDSVATVTVSCSIPSGVSNGNTGLVALVATARTNDGANTMGGALTETGAATSGVDIVFADSAGTDDTTITGDADGLRDAAHSDRNTYQVSTAVLGVSKTVTTVCDPFNGTSTPKNIPGSLVKWAITVTNSGTSSATLTSMTDPLDVTNTTIDTDFEQGNSAANCAAAANVPTSASGSGFRVSCTGGTRACASSPVFFTTAADTDAIADSGGTVNINFNGGVLTGTSGAALPAEAGYAAGELKPGESVTVQFQVFVN